MSSAPRSGSRTRYRVSVWWPERSTGHGTSERINQKPANKPWKISFSYGRALQDPALATWLGSARNYEAAQQAYCHRARCNAAASLGAYTAEMENEFKDNSARQYKSERPDD